MKLHLPLPLRTCLLTACGLLAAGAARATTATTWDGQVVTTEDGETTRAKNWGNTLYIGDSISHGYHYQSYRWQLFKTLVDNDIIQNEVGIQSGYFSSPGSNNITYGGKTFENLHAAQSSIKASQVAGVTSNTSLVAGTSIINWLDSDGESKYRVVDNVADAAVTGSTPAANSTAAVVRPDTAFIMLGTNDVFGDCINYDEETGTGNVLDTATNIQSYLDTIISTLQDRDEDGSVSDTEASSVNIIVTTLPTWSEDRLNSSITNKNMNTEANYAAQVKYNELLKEWAAGRNDVTLVDVNVGLIDVKNEGTSKEGAGVGALFWDDNYGANSESQHPNRQGDLIIAGNIARQLGYAGRTAGQLRVDIEDTVDGRAVFTHADADTLEISNEGSLRADWSTDVSNGFTVDFGFDGGLGNGATDGWLTDSNFSLSLGDGTKSGTLNVNEAYIQWGDTILYSTDTSGLTDADSLRVAYVYGNAQQNLSSGFYVWMGDMLIGEALLPTLSGDTATNGISLTNNSGDTVTLTHLSMAAGSWAPTTTGYVGYAEGEQPIIPADATIVYTYATMTMPDTTSGNTQIRNNACNDEGNAITSGAVHITVDGGTVKTGYLVGNQGNYDGNIHITLTGTINSSGNTTYNPLNYNGTLTGDLSFLVDSKFESETTWGPFAGADTDDHVNGSITMEFSSAQFKTDAARYGTYGGALLGSYAANVSGAINIIINAGEFNGDVYGAKLKSGNNITGGTHITINGGKVTGNVYGGANGGTLGTSTNTSTPGSTITISGGASIGGSTISSGGNNANVTIYGGTELTVKDMTAQSKFATYSGTLDGEGEATVHGTRKLNFERVDMRDASSSTGYAAFNATLTNFDSVSLCDNSHVSLASFGFGDGTTGSISVDGSSVLDISGGTHTATVQNSGTITIHEGASLTADGAGMDGNVSGIFNVHGGALTISRYDHLDTAFNITSGSLSVTEGTQPDGSTRMGVGGVHVNATGEVSLNNVALKDVHSFAVQEGGSVSATLNGDALQLSGITSLAVTGETNDPTIALNANSATLVITSSDTTTPFTGLSLGENGSLTLDTLNLTLGSGYSLVTAGEGKLYVNQGSLSAGVVNIAASSLNESQKLAYTGIGTEGGNSYVGYKVYTEATLTGNTSFGNDAANSVANTVVSGLTSGNINVTTNGGTLTSAYLVAHYGEGTGDIEVTLGGTFIQDNTPNYNVAHYTNTLNGNITQVIAKGFKVQKTDGTLVTMRSFNGADGGNVTGNVTMVFSSEDLSVRSNRNGAVSGVYGSSVGESVKLTINAGSFSGDIVGANNNSTVGEDVNIDVNGGTITGTVTGAHGSNNGSVGGNINVTINGGTISSYVTGTYTSKVEKDVNILVAGGTVKGNVSAAMLNSAANNPSNTIEGNTNVTISGGKVEGAVYGGNAHNADGVIKGNTSVTVTGEADIAGNIYAGSNGGTIQGSTTLTLKEITETSAFADYTGTLNGGLADKVTGNRTLCFDGVKLDSFDGTLTNFSHVELNGGSTVTLSSLGGATHLCIEEGSSLSLAVENTLSLNETFLSLGLSSQDEYILTITGGSLSISTLTLNLSKDVCDYLANQSAATPMALAEDHTAPATLKLQLGSGDISAENININLDESYADYTVSNAYTRLIANDDDTTSTYICFDLTQNGAIPEPATATLTLLALAGLAARRRRK